MIHQTAPYPYNNLGDQLGSPLALDLMQVVYLCFTASDGFSVASALLSPRSGRYVSRTIAAMQARKNIMYLVRGSIVFTWGSLVIRNPPEPFGMAVPRMIAPMQSI